MMQVARGMDGTKRKRPKHPNKKNHAFRRSVGDDLAVVEGDKVTPTNPEENKNRRTIVLDRTEEQPWGFTIQSYGIHHKKEDEVELLTYVDYVAHGSPACYAGMRPGDVILSINGTNMEESDHMALITFIKSCGDHMRVVVLFEDCCRKVDLHLRYLKLKRVLAEKIFELRSLEQQEMRIMSGMSRFDSCRSSRASSASSNSYWDDRRSLVPELDRCPTPMGHAGVSTPQDADSSSNQLLLPTFQRSASLSPSPFAGRSFDFEYSGTRHGARRYRPPSLAASASLNAAINASLRNGFEASGGSSPSLERRSPIFQSDSSSIQEHSNGDFSPRQQRRYHNQHRLHPVSSTPEHLYATNPALVRPSWHASAPDKLSPVKRSFNEEVELSLFKLHLRGADTGESTTESLDVSNNDDKSLKAAASVHRHEHKSYHDMPKTSSLPQLASTSDRNSSLEVLSENRRSAVSLTSSNGSSLYENDSTGPVLYASSPVSEPGSPYSIGACSVESNFSYSDLPAIEIELVNDEDAVSHL